MQQYFVNGRAEELVTITDKDTAKHMFSVMRLAEGDEVVLVFEDGIKRLARVVSSSPWAASCCTIFVRWLREMPCASATSLMVTGCSRSWQAAQYMSTRSV